MKKLKLAMLTVVLGLAFVGCKEISCTDAQSAVETALSNLLQNDTDANCNAYKDALRDAIDDSDCPTATKEGYQVILNLGC